MLEMLNLESRICTGTIEDVPGQEPEKEGNQLAMAYIPKTDVIVLMKNHCSFDIYEQLVTNYLEITEDMRRGLKDQLEDRMVDFLEDALVFLDEVYNIRKMLREEERPCQ